MIPTLYVLIVTTTSSFQLEAQFRSMNDCTTSIQTGVELLTQTHKIKLDEITSVQTACRLEIK